MGSIDSPNVFPNATRETEVLVAGGGPVGMVAAYQLARCGVACLVIEQSPSTTRWPKMEFTNGRSMELYRKMGLSEGLRKEAVPGHFHLNEIITTGFGDTGNTVTVWERESPDVLREKWMRSNDGSHPLEPYMRLSQIIFEALLKSLVQKNPAIDSLWGHTFTNMIEMDDAVYSTVTDAAGHETVIKSKYVIGCDGAGSTVRMKAGLESKRNSMPIDMLLVHFKSRDISRLQSQGLFWHCMLLNGAAMVSQDEVDTWTIHQMVPPGTDPESIDPLAFISSNLGGLGDPYPVKVDEVLVKSTWRFDLAVADSFRSAKGRVFLAGDAAHQLSPAGGHGLNSGIADVFDLGWKLAAVLKGYGGPHLLDSYDYERRAVAQNNSKIVEKCTMEIIMPMFSVAQKYGREAIIAKDEDGKKLRAELKGWMDDNYWLHDQQGTDMGYRFNGSPVVLSDDDASVEPPQSVRKYVASTWPGSRAPHVFLADGETSIFDLYGPGYTIVDFTSRGEISDAFVGVAKRLGIPLTKLHLPEEKHARRIWERDVVLLRPEGHVAWRASADRSSSLEKDALEDILLVAVGKKVSLGHKPTQ